MGDTAAYCCLSLTQIMLTDRFLLNCEHKNV